MQNLTNRKISDLSLDFGHFMVIAVCAVFLVSLTYIKNGFSFNSPKEQKEQYTYEQARLAVLSGQESNHYPENYAQDTKKQLAELATGLGQVAGISTINPSELLELPPASEVFGSENLKTIPIKEDSDNGGENIKKFSEFVSEIEIEYDTLGLLNSLSSSDKEELDRVAQGYKKIVGVLMSNPTPSSLADYARLKILLYTHYAAAAQYYAGGLSLSKEDAEELFKQTFLINDRLNSIVLQIFEKYQVELPE